MNTGSNRLSPYMDTNEVQKTIELLGFFKRINNTITYSVADWSTTLLDAVKNKIKGLVVAPPTEYANGILTIKGTLVGTSDINAALRHHPNPIKINVYGLNTLFLDEDITSHGTSLHLLAPQWKVIGTRKIDLSGKNGVHGDRGLNVSWISSSSDLDPRIHLSGTDGQPGKPGSNGGHFYGRGFTFHNLTQFTTKTDGGNGGNGGPGGNGREGESSKTKYPQPYKTVQISETEQHHYYDNGWSDAEPGGNGGRGGAKGIGGYAGDSFLDEHPWNSAPQNGEPGVNGSPGKHGKGGMHYSYYKGITVSMRHDPPYQHIWYEISDSTVKIDRGYARDGYQPSSTDLNTSGQQQPTAQAPLNPVPIVQQYKLYSSQEANNPIVSPFMKVFPNLN